MRRLFGRYCKASETILWARLQMLTAAVITVLATIDPLLFAGYIPAGYLPIYIFISGVITELARRARARDL
jgi:drug/metabolite transporter superfamily protein YnfA